MRKGGQERLHEQKALEIHVMFFTDGVGSGVRGVSRGRLYHNHAVCVWGAGGWLLRVSEPFRVEGKELAENGPGKADWPQNAEQRSGHWVQQAVDKPPEGSAVDPL